VSGGIDTIVVGGGQAGLGRYVRPARASVSHDPVVQSVEFGSAGTAVEKRRTFGTKNRTDAATPENSRV
jgi:hypothetical protein